MQDKLVKDIQKKLIRACEENLTLGSQMNKLANKLMNATENQDNLFIEIYQTELHACTVQYSRNSKTVGESIIQLGIIKPNFIYN